MPSNDIKTCWNVLLQTAHQAGWLREYGDTEFDYFYKIITEHATKRPPSPPDFEVPVTCPLPEKNT